PRHRSTRMTCRCTRMRRPRRPALFPYTTLFRSLRRADHRGGIAERGGVDDVARAWCPAGGGLAVETGDLDWRHGRRAAAKRRRRDRKSTRLNSSHVKKSYAVFCLKKKKKRDRKG